MVGAPYQKTLTLSLVAAVANGVALSQAGTAATALTLNGSLVTGGVAKFDVPRRIGITSAGNDSAINFTIVGTNYSGNKQTEVLAGANIGTAQTVRDFATVTSITPSGNTAANITAGTTSVASTAPYVCDAIAIAQISVANIVSGVVNYTIEETFDDFSPNWDIYTVPPTWFATGMANETTNSTGTLNSPANMVRLTINSGTGSVTTRIIQAFRAGAA